MTVNHALGPGGDDTAVPGADRHLLALASAGYRSTFGLLVDSKAVIHRFAFGLIGRQPPMPADCVMPI